MSPTTTHRPLPEALTRNDTDTGGWSVDGCGMERGVPHTNIPNRVMVAPHHDHPVARVIRAHEMIHAKVSPLDIAPWVARGIATETSLRACEEYRVNHLVKKAGFDTKVLLDGSERLSAERFVATDDWASTLLLAVSTANTGGYREVLKVVRKHKPTWARVIEDVVKRMNREVRKRRDLASTATNEFGSVLGFQFTELIAEWCDRLGAITPPETPKSPEGGSGSDDKTDDKTGDKTGDDGGDSDTPTPPKRGRGRPRKSDTVPTDNPHGKIGIAPTHTIPDWFPLAVEKLPTPISVTGAIGKKRVASNSGRHPRRLHRLLTDPQKRVFDRVIRGKGGVVLIDCSGSMRLNESEVRELTEVSHGATVLAYTVQNWVRDDDGVPTSPNAWVLSERGRMANLTDGLPFQGMANGVDLPALKWAVENRKHPNAPIVWVCDGYVTGHRDQGHPLMTKVCYEFARRNRIILVPDVPQALDALRRLGRGEKVRNGYEALRSLAPELIMDSE